MNKISLANEKDAVDLVTNCMFSVDFLASISDLIFSEHAFEVTVGQFYGAWLQNAKVQEEKIPFNLGIVLGYLYCGLLFTKENWFDLLPNTPASQSGDDWQMTSVNIVTPKKATPTVKYVLRRMRNALGHGNISLYLGEGERKKSNMMNLVRIDFHDFNPRDTDDTFDATFGLPQLIKIIRSFHHLLYNHVKSKAS